MVTLTSLTHQKLPPDFPVCPAFFRGSSCVSCTRTCWRLSERPQLLGPPVWAFSTFVELVRFRRSQHFLLNFLPAALLTSTGGSRGVSCSFRSVFLASLIQFPDCCWSNTGIALHSNWRRQTFRATDLEFAASPPFSVEPVHWPRPPTPTTLTVMKER